MGGRCRAYANLEGDALRNKKKMLAASYLPRDLLLPTKCLLMPPFFSFFPLFFFLFPLFPPFFCRRRRAYANLEGDALVPFGTAAFYLPRRQPGWGLFEKEVSDVFLSKSRAINDARWASPHLLTLLALY